MRQIDNDIKEKRNKKYNELGKSLPCLYFWQYQLYWG